MKPKIGQQALQPALHHPIALGLMASPIGVLILRGPDHRVELANAAISRVAGRIETGKPLRAEAAVIRTLHRVRATGRPDEMDEVRAARIGARRKRPSPAVVSLSFLPLPPSRTWEDAMLVLAADVTGHVEARRVAGLASRTRDEALLRRGRGLALERAGRIAAEAAGDAAIVGRVAAEAAVLAEHAGRLVAEAAREARDSFFARVIHELGTPNATLQLWLSLLQDNDPKDETGRLRALAAIQESATAQTKLIDDLVDLSRGMSHKLRLSLAPVALAEVVTRAAEEFVPAAKAAGIALEIRAGGRALVSADRSRIRQMVGNLLSNALKFTPAGGHVRLRHFSGKKWAGFEIHDDGAGIDRRAIGDVFSPFRQGEGITVRMHGGLGLGLAIVRELVRLHGGRVDAKSPGRGRGATFRVRLPRL